MKENSTASLMLLITLITGAQEITPVIGKHFFCLFTPRYVIPKNNPFRGYSDSIGGPVSATSFKFFESTNIYRIFW
jgi:hypothetical protein